MKKLVRIILLLLISTVLVSCQGGIAIELDTPQNIAIQDGVVTWDAVTDAESYLVSVGTQIFTVTDTTFNLNELNLDPGEHLVHIVAMKGTAVSLPSVTVHFVIESLSIEAISAAALLSINNTYAPNMVESDFEDEYAYKSYTQTTQLVDKYSSTAVALGMSEHDAIALFTHVATLPERSESINNFNSLFGEIDSFYQFGVDSTELANMLYELGMVGITIQISNLTDDIANAQEEFNRIQSDLLILQETVSENATYAELAQYATVPELVLLDYFFTGQYEDTYYVTSVISSIAYDLVYNDEYYDPYYLDSGDEYIQMFYDILVRAKTADDTILLNSLLIGSPLFDIYLLADQYMMLDYTTESMTRYASDIVRLGELYAFFAIEKTMIIESMASVFDYLTLVYDTIPASTVLLLDDLAANGELSMEEYVTLKNEIVNVLYVTLPSSQDFANVYTTLINVAGAFQDVDLDGYLPYVNFFGDLDHATLDLYLTFALDINQQTVEDVMSIVDGMIIPGEYVYDDVYEYEYYEQDTVNFEKAVELAVYVGNYVQNFKLDHAAKFDALDALKADAQVEQLFNLFGNAVKQAMALEMSPDEYALAEMAIDEILADYDDILAATDIIKSIGMDVFNEFLATNGQMFIDIYHLVDTGSSDFSDPLFVAALESIFTQLLDYNTIVMDEIDISSIQTLLGLIRIPLKVQLMMEETMDSAEFDLLFNTLLTPVSMVIFNARTIQEEFLTAVDALDVETLLFDSDWVISGDEAMMSILVLALDDTLDFIHETLFFASITIVSDSILKNADIMDLMGTTTTEIDDEINQIETAFHELFDEIHAIADFDFTTITQVEIDRINALFQSFQPVEVVTIR